MTSPAPLSQHPVEMGWGSLSRWAGEAICARDWLIMQGAQARLPLQNYGEHGRELITVEVALRLLQTLADPSAELQGAEKLHGLGRPDLQATLHNTVFKVLSQSR